MGKEVLGRPGRFPDSYERDIRLAMRETSGHRRSTDARPGGLRRAHSPAI
jgi:hypothetical protein